MGNYSKQYLRITSRGFLVRTIPRCLLWISSSEYTVNIMTLKDYSMKKLPISDGPPSRLKKDLLIQFEVEGSRGR
jgi:hypothetical protein